MKCAVPRFAGHREVRTNCNFKDGDLPLETVRLAQGFSIGSGRDIRSIPLRLLYQGDPNYTPAFIFKRAIFQMFRR